MNAEPHTHNIEFGRQYSNQTGYWTVTYGDTTLYCHQGPFFQRRLNRAVRAAIAWHDEASIKAGNGTDQAGRIRQIKANAIASANIDPAGGWASARLAKKS